MNNSNIFEIIKLLFKVLSQLLSALSKMNNTNCHVITHIKADLKIHSFNSSNNLIYFLFKLNFNFFSKNDK